jgi:iron complex outermembrane receptor protein
VGSLSGENFANNTWINFPFPFNTLFDCHAFGDPLQPRCADFFGVNQGLGPLQVCQDPGILGFPFGNVRCDTGVVASGDGLSPGVGLGDNLTQQLFEHQKTTSFAVFTQADWEFIEDWTFTLGVRWTKETKDFRAGQAYLSSVARQRVKNFPAYANLHKTWSDVSPKAGLSWQASDDVLLYLSYSEGFHSGGFFGVNQNVADFVRDQYDPETARSYEIGAKTRWFDNRVQLNGAYFYNQFKNKQEQAVQFDPSTNTVATVFSNVADAVYQGIDLELQWVPVDSLNLFLSFGWLDAEYRDFFTDINPNDNNNCPVPVVGGQCIEDASFLRPRNAPKFTAGAGFTYRLEIGPGEAEAGLKYNWVDAIETNLLNLKVGRLDARSDLQLTTGYRYKKVSVMFFARNLTNEQYEVPFLIQPLFASGSIVPGRTYGVDITVELGGD